MSRLPWHFDYPIGWTFHLPQAAARGKQRLPCGKGRADWASSEGLGSDLVYTWSLIRSSHRAAPNFKGAGKHSRHVLRVGGHQ